jgi:hypothetical protein
MESKFNRRSFLSSREPRIEAQGDERVEGIDERSRFDSRNLTPKELAGTEGGGSLPDARRFTHPLAASAARLLEELRLQSSRSVLVAA